MAFLTKTANRGSISTGYTIENSLKFEGTNTEYLSYTNSVGENRRTWTYSTWVKITEVGNADDCRLFAGHLSVNDRCSVSIYQNQFQLFGKTSGVTAVNVRTSRKLRDPSAWYHLMIVLDTTESTETDRVKLYINGVQETVMTDTIYPPLNYSLQLNNAINHYVGQKGDNTGYFDGYMAETYFVDGSALVPTDFGEFDNNGIWIPIEYDGAEYPSQDTNHWYLKFDDASNLGKDSSGNGKNMTSNNISSVDQSTDTPTNNFATFNPLALANASNVGISSGATTLNSQGDTNGWRSAASSIAVSSGKWYVEFTAAGNTTFCGVSNINDYDPDTNYYGNWNTSIGFYGLSGLLFIDGASQTWSGLAYGSGDIVGIALDKDNGYVYMSKNGTWANSGDPTSGASGTGGVALTQGNSDYSTSDYFYIGGSHNINSGVLQANYGGYTTDTPASPETDENGYGTFEYAPPSGYYALCTKNLAEYG
jgi:hypothetical protein